MGEDSGRLQGTVWITGAGGLIGSHIVRLAPPGADGLRLAPLTRTDLDLTDFSKLRDRFLRDQPVLVFHCAAVSKSRECEDKPALARIVNVEVTRRLADLAERGKLIFFSTDLVFDGKAGNYDESAAPNPITVYGETKAEAEKLVLAHPNHLVIRTSLNAGISPTGDRAFTEDTRRAWAAGKTTQFFTDEFRNPIHAELTARAAWELALGPHHGICHVAGRERLSRWEIGQLLARRWAGLSPRLEATSLRTFQGPPRAPDTTLNCRKVEAILPFPLQGFREWLQANPDAPL